MTALAQLLLVITSLAPIAVVYAAVLADHGRWLAAGIILVVAVVLLAVCGFLLFGARRIVAEVPMEAKDTAPKQSDSLSFLVAYALPLLALKSVDPKVPVGLCVFVAIVALVLWQQQIFHVNPVLALVGFRFFSAKDDAGQHIMIITRKKTLGDGVLQVVKLSCYLWLDYARPDEPRGGESDGGVSASDPQGSDDTVDPD